MPKQPLVSIIIPTFNRAHLLSETLDSVLAQTYPNWECIVVDDGSKDNTAEVMQDYCDKDSRFQYHHRPKDRMPGGNAARNYGLELSNGEYINWFDDDDVMLPEFLNSKVNIFINDPLLELVICSGSYVNKNLQNRQRINLKIDSFLYKDYVLWEFKIVTNNVMFKKGFLCDKELFNINLLRGQETELLSRLFFNLSEKQYTIVNKPLFLYRQHDETKTKKNEIYKHKFKISEFYNYLRNLKKSILLNDMDLINFCYYKSINILFQAIKNNDNVLAMDIINNIYSVLRLKNKIKAYKFIMLSKLVLFLNIPSHKLKKLLVDIKYK